MTSETLSRHPSDGFNKLINIKLLCNNIRQHRALAIVAAVILFFARPLVQIIALMNYYNSPNTQMRQSLYSYALNNARDTGMFVALAALVLAAAIGLSVTGYMHNGKAAIFYNSLPIRRLSLFATQYVSGLAYFLPAFFASYILSVLIMPFGSAVGANTAYYLGALFFFLLVYSFIILCANIAGTLMNSLVTSFYLCAVMPAVFFTAVTFLDMFYRFTSIHGMTASPAWQFIYYPVVVFFPSVFAAYRYLSLLDCVLMLAFAAALTCLAYLFNRLTKTEDAAKPFYFAKALAILKYSALAVSVITSGMIFYMASGSNLIFMIVGMPVGGFLALMFVNLVIYKSIREAFRGIRQFVILVACAALLAGLVSADIFGIDRHIPDASRVSSVSYTRWVQSFSYDFSFEERSYRHSPRGANNIIIDDPEAIQLVNDVFAAALNSERRRSHRTLAYHGYHGVYSDSAPLMNHFGTIYYNMRGGGFWAKRLDIHGLSFAYAGYAREFEQAIGRLRESAGYKRAFYYPLTDATAMQGHLDSSEYFTVTLYSGDVYATVLSRSMSRAEMQSVINIINEDIAGMSMLNNTSWLYSLMLVFRNADGYTGHISMTLNDREFTRTLEFIFGNFN